MLQTCLINNGVGECSCTSLTVALFLLFNYYCNAFFTSTLLAHCMQAASEAAARHGLEVQRLCNERTKIQVRVHAGALAVP